MKTIDNLAISLLTKPFTVLYGPSGTGKTRAAVKLSQMIDRHSEQLKLQNNKRLIKVDNNGKILSPSTNTIKGYVEENIHNDNCFKVESNGITTTIKINFCTDIEFEDVSLKPSFIPHNENDLEIVIENNLPCYKVISVGSNWTDNTALMGYVNPFGSGGNMVYEITPFLELLILANHPENTLKPHFLILDEMNLSHVEYYLSDILSLMETSQYGDNTVINYEKLKIIEKTLKLNYSKYNKYLLSSIENLLSSNTGLLFPKNLFIVGTINLDETTQMLSNKVLDRAHLIKIDTLSPSTALTNGDYNSLLNDEVMYNKFGILMDYKITHNLNENFRTHYNTLITTPAKFVDVELLNTLDSVYEELHKIDQGFGYRITQEFFNYLIIGYEFYDRDSSYLIKLLNKAIVQKVLVKLQGNRRILVPAINELKQIFNSTEYDEITERLNNLNLRLELRGQATFIS